jgi:hypothetical protein
VPAKKPDGTEWTKDRPLEVRVIVAGATSGNAVVLTLKP